VNAPLLAVFVPSAELRGIGAPMADGRTASVIPLSRANMFSAAGAAAVCPTTDFAAPADPAGCVGRQPVAVPGPLSAAAVAARCSCPRQRVV